MKKYIKLIFKTPMSFYWYFKNRLLFNKINLEGRFKKIIRPLKENGFYVIGNSYGNVRFIDIENDMQKIISEHELIKSGQEKGRIINPHKLSSNLVQYTEYLTTIASEYFDNKNISVEMSLYQKSIQETNVTEIPGGEGFHIDDGKKTLKFFLYLTNVDETNGPFCYIPKSHGISGWRKFLRIIKWNILNEHFTLYFDDQYVNVTEKILVCAEKGTLFCADTTGFHKATQLINGSREIFVVSFNEKRFDLLPKRKLAM